MDDYLKQALEIVKAQASVRVMSEEEITSMVRTLSAPAMPPAKSIKEKSVTCLECGKTFKIITRKHLATHDLDAESYREKWGLKKHTPLVCKELQRERRKKMKDMQLWEKRRIGGANRESE